MEHLSLHLPKLTRFAYSLTGARADAEDLAQSTVERAINAKVALRGDELSFWLFRVCRNLWIDQTRKRSTEASWLEENRQAPEANGGEGEALQRFSELERALSILSREQRSVLFLVGVEGYSYKEAAELLDCPIGTVMSRLARARAQLASSYRSDHV